MTHDASYKLLFSHAELVADLPRGFLPPAWVEQLDLASLEKVSGSYVSDDPRARHNDVVWRLRWGPRWLYVYILLEMQSLVDRFMAVRLLSYVGLLYQDLINAQRLSGGGKLPAVLPIVLYNGEQRWRAATKLSELIEPPPAGLEPFQPSLRYLLLDEGRYSAEELSARERNLAAALFRLERGPTLDGTRALIEALEGWLRAPALRYGPCRSTRRLAGSGRRSRTVSRDRRMDHR